MSDPIPVCREITLRIPRSDRSGTLIEERPVSETTQLVSDYVRELFPGRSLEHMGRERMLCLDRGHIYTGISSLAFQAVHLCFSQHHPFALRPEVLMQIIAHEVAVVVKRYPDHYRGLFTRSPIRETIRIVHNGLRLGDPHSPWDEAILLFEEPLKEQVPDGIMDHLLPNFSTATGESRVASLVTFMDATSAYYDLVVATLCGIPRIRLMGTAEDYRKLLLAASQLAERFDRHMHRYFTELLPVLRILADQAAGAPIDEDFWKSIYKHQSASGCSVANGWMTAFVNFVHDTQHKDGRLVQKPDRAFDWRADGGHAYCMPGISPAVIPSHVSSVPFIWEYLGSTVPMIFIGGPLGVDVVDGFVTPVLSYGVLRDS